MANTHDDSNTTHTSHAYKLQLTTHDILCSQETFVDLHASKQNDEGLVAVS